jgi:hypothetical protein
MMLDEDDPENREPRCFGTSIDITSRPYLNGLPLIRDDLEIVGDAVKVIVHTEPFCEIVMPQSLPFRWQVTGPAGPVTLSARNTLRPHFHPTVAGDYEALLTYCPLTCRNGTVESITGDIPPQSAKLKFQIVNELPLPPDTEPVLNSLASGNITCVDSSGATVECVDTDHLKRQTKCGLRNSSFGPQLVPVHPWVNQSSYQLVEGQVVASKMSGIDAEINHSSHDAIAEVKPDPRYVKLKVPAEKGVEKEAIDIEWESNSFPGPMRPLPGDRVSAFGFHTYDCHHHDDRFHILAELHPLVLTAVHRKRPIQIPNGFGGLGNNIYIPGIITDIWANRRAGEMTSNCSTSGMHQANVNDNVDGACIRSPHPLERQFTFHIYLPPNPQKRLAAAGVSAPPAPLYVNVERASSGAPMPRVDVVAPGGVTSLTVTVDLTGYSEMEYSARIVAGWIQPSPDNWGLERWKVGIEAIDIKDDHDTFFPNDDGDWVFWAAINNRDKEWTRLLDGGGVTGFHNFGGRPFETESPDADRSLGPHLLLFHPRPVDFPGHALEDLNRSFLIHSSGYDAELFDDPTGEVNNLIRLGSIPATSRQNVQGFSDKGDYILHYFFEDMGTVLPNLSAAGKALASTFTVRPREARCTRVSNRGCVLFPEASVAQAWHPLLARIHPGEPALVGSDFAVFKPQEPEELGFTGMSKLELMNSLIRAKEADPQRVEQFMIELRQEFDAVRGTQMEREFAKALPVLKASLPPDLWQRHFSDIDPTRVGRSSRWLWVIIVTAIVIILAAAAFRFFRRPSVRTA